MKFAKVRAPPHQSGPIFLFLTFPIFYINLKAAKEEAVNVVRKIWSVIVAIAFLSLAAICVRASIGLVSIDSNLTTFQKAYSLVVSFFMAIILLSLAVNRIRVGWRKERPQQQEEEDEEDDV